MGLNRDIDFLVHDQSGVVLPPFPAKSAPLLDSDDNVVDSVDPIQG